METTSNSGAERPLDLAAVRHALEQLAEHPSPGAPARSTLDQVDLWQNLLGDDLCRRLGIFRLPDDFRLSVVIPCYNEVHTIEQVIERVRTADLPTEIIVVDDGSRDGTRDILDRMRDRPDLKIVFHEKNQGKGAALRTGFLEATGTVVVVQDADLEYDPHEFRWLVQPIVENKADVVFGTRFGHNDRPVSPLWHLAVNQFITRMSNLKTGLRLTDVETCYKMFRRELIQEIAPGLRERGFGIEIEMAHKMAKKRRVRFYERPVSYARRTYAEGKKIGAKDGFWALWCILRY